MMKILLLILILIAAGSLWWMREDKMRTLQSIFSETRYLNTRDNFMKIVFQGEAHLQRREASAALVDDFQTSKYLEILPRYFDMSIDNKSLDALMQLELATDKLYKATAARNLSPKYLDRYIPTFTMSCSKGSLNTEHSVRFDRKTIKEVKRYMKKMLVNTSALQYQQQKITTEMKNRILKRDNYTCQCCGNNTQTEPNLVLKVDYIVPISKGGKAVPSNLQTLCWICSKEKDNI